MASGKNKDKLNECVTPIVQQILNDSYIKSKALKKLICIKT